MLKVEEKNRVAIVKIGSNLLIDNVDAFEAEVSKKYSQGLIVFIFDFGGVDYVCSAALGVLAQLLKNLYEEKSGRVYFCCLSEKLKSLFDAMQFTAIVNVEDDFDSALEKAEQDV